MTDPHDSTFRAADRATRTRALIRRSSLVGLATLAGSLAGGLRRDERNLRRPNQ